MRWTLLGRGPLSVAPIGATPHRHSSVAVGLLRDPFDHVEPILRFSEKRGELALRVATPPSIHGEKREPVSGEESGALMKTLSGVRSEGNDRWRRLSLKLRKVY